MAEPRILIVEDEESISEPLSSFLAREGFEPRLADTIEHARRELRTDAPDLVLLDVMLPDGDGLDLCREIRAGHDVPIIMLTARGTDVDKIVGLEQGADDYVVKPFSAGELVARIRAILRRGRSREPNGVVEIGDIRLDAGARTVTRGGEAVTLTAREFDLLACLMNQAGRVVRREQIMDQVWDEHWFGSTKTLDVHIAWLRKKLERDPAHPSYITTFRGVGFRFADPSVATRG
jgi:two-component system response regulator RegX3